MGWCEPMLFCTASKIASDIVQELVESKQLLQLHPLEHFCLLGANQLPPPGKKEINCLMKMLEVLHGQLYWNYTSTIAGQTRTFQASHHAWYPQSVSTTQTNRQPGRQMNFNRKLKKQDGHWSKSKEILG